MKKTKYEFKNQWITIQDDVIKVENTSGYQTSFELIINNKKLIPSIQKFMYENKNIHKFIKIKYINNGNLWGFSCENKVYFCSGEDLSLLNLDM